MEHKKMFWRIYNLVNITGLCVNHTQESHYRYTAEGTIFSES